MLLAPVNIFKYGLLSIDIIISTLLHVIISSFPIWSNQGEMFITRTKDFIQQLACGQSNFII